MKLQRNSRGVYLDTARGTRIMVRTGQRSAGRRLFGPVFLSTELHRYSVGYYNVTVGNPRKVYRWAFSVWFYYRLPRRG